MNAHTYAVKEEVEGGTDEGTVISILTILTPPLLVYNLDPYLPYSSDPTGHVPASRNPIMQGSQF